MHPCVFNNNDVTNIFPAVFNVASQNKETFEETKGFALSRRKSQIV